MKWKHPPITKIYEALGTVADGRVKISGNRGQVFSSSGNKYYAIEYDKDANAVMANDNASYWRGYLGYPSIAFLMSKGVLSYSDEMGEILKGTAWKDVNQKFKNDFEKALEHILSSKTEEQRKRLENFVNKVDKEIKGLGISLLGKKVLPPEGY